MISKIVTDATQFVYIPRISSVSLVYSTLSNIHNIAIIKNKT